MPEINTQRLIVEWLNLNKIVAWIAEVPQGMKSKHSPTGRRCAMNRGQPDIIAVHKGRALFFEVKQEKHRKRISDLYKRIQSGDYSIYSKFKDYHVKEQADFLLRLKKHGAIAEFVFSLDDVQKIICDCGESDNANK